MADLGEFGAALRELEGERDTFSFFGERFTVSQDIPPMLMLQLGAAATGKVEESEGLAAMWEAMRCSLGDDEFARFYKLAVSKRADLESLMRLTFKLFEAQGGRPTQEPQGSSPGLSTTSLSPSGSSSRWEDKGLRPISSVLAG